MLLEGWRDPAGDHVERDALASHLGRMRVTQLVWGEAAPHPGLVSESAELDSHGRGRSTVSHGLTRR